MTKYAQKILELLQNIPAGEEGDIEKAQLAGTFMDDAGVSRETVKAFAGNLSNDEIQEMIAQLEDCAEEDAV